MVATAAGGGGSPPGCGSDRFESATAFDEHDLTRAQVLAADALRLTQRAGLQEHPFSAIARFVSGRGYAQRGELGKALEEIERGIELANRVGAWHIAVYGLLAAAEVSTARTCTGRGTAPHWPRPRHP